MAQIKIFGLWVKPDDTVEIRAYCTERDADEIKKFFNDVVGVYPFGLERIIEMVQSQQYCSRREKPATDEDILEALKTYVKQLNRRKVL